LYPDGNKIDFEIRSLDNMVVYQKSGIKEHIFSLDIAVEGEYKFIFASRRSSEKFIINFALDVHNASSEYL
jgi:hypothetical protein